MVMGYQSMSTVKFPQISEEDRKFWEDAGKEFGEILQAESDRILKRMDEDFKRIMAILPESQELVG